MGVFNNEKSCNRSSWMATLLAVSISINALVPALLCEQAYAQTGAEKNAGDGDQLLKVEVEKEAKVTAQEPGKSSDKDESSDASSAQTSTEAPASSDKDAENTKKLTVDDIRIEGNRLVATEDITNVLKTKRGDTFVREKVLDDLQAINEMGCFDEKSLQVVPELSNGGVLLKIRVQENAPVTEFSFQGNNVIKSEDIAKLFSNQLGKPQNLSQLSNSIAQVEQMYHDKGFVLARVTDVKDFPDGSISLNINEGQIDKIEISGNKKTKDYIIRNVLRIKPGTVYNEQQLAADLKKLYNNGYFQDIRRSLSPSPDNPEKFALKIDVDEKRTGSVGLGGGVDSLAGPFGSLSFSDGNFRGRGQVLSFNSQMGSGLFSNFNNTVNNGGTSFLPTNQRTYQIEASWIEPSLKGTNASLAVSGYGRNYASMMIDQAMQRTIGANITLTKPLGHHLNASLSMMGEDTVLKDLGNYLGTGSTLDTMTSRALSLGQAATQDQAAALAQQARNNQLKGGIFMTAMPTLAYDTRDAAIDPSKGTYAKISGGPSLGLNGSSFARLGASFSKFIPLGKDTTFAFNTQGGQAFGGIPQFAQYRLGGWNGMRGYRQFSDLGTGSRMLMSTAEVRTKVPFLGDSKASKFIDKHVKLASFCDFGAVSGNSLTNGLLGRANMGAAVGVGIRVKIPMVGLVRLDYGLPLISSALGHMTPRFTVGFGEKF